MVFFYARTLQQIIDLNLLDSVTQQTINNTTNSTQVIYISPELLRLIE